MLDVNIVNLLHGRSNSVFHINVNLLGETKIEVKKDLGWNRRCECFNVTMASEVCARELMTASKFDSSAYFAVCGTICSFLAKLLYMCTRPSKSAKTFSASDSAAPDRVSTFDCKVVSSVKASFCFTMSFSCKIDMLGSDKTLFGKSFTRQE